MFSSLMQVKVNIATADAFVQTDCYKFYEFVSIIICMLQDIKIIRDHNLNTET